jgi:hypothetical protein
MHLPVFTTFSENDHNVVGFTTFGHDSAYHKQFGHFEYLIRSIGKQPKLSSQKN